LLGPQASGPRPGDAPSTVDSTRRAERDLVEQGRQGGGFLEPWPFGPPVEPTDAAFRAGNAPRHFLVRGQRVLTEALL